MGVTELDTTNQLNSSNYLLEASHSYRSILKVREICFHLLKRIIPQNFWMYFKTTVVILSVKN